MSINLTISLLSGDDPCDCELVIGVDEYHYEGEGQIIHSDDLPRLIGAIPAEVAIERLFEREARQ